MRELERAEEALMKDIIVLDDKQVKIIQQLQQNPNKEGKGKPSKEEPAPTSAAPPPATHAILIQLTAGECVRHSI